MVNVLDRNGRPMMACSEKSARLMLERGRTRVHKVFPFTIRVVDRKFADSVLHPDRVKLDSCSKVAGLAVQLIRFDMQKMESPDIEGVEYQRGTSR